MKDKTSKSETPRNTRSKYWWKHSAWMLTDHLEVTHLHRHLQGTGLPRYPHRQALVNLAEGTVTEAPADTETTAVGAFPPALQHFHSSGSFSDKLTKKNRGNRGTKICNEYLFSYRYFFFNSYYNTIITIL